jgi:hypothetical protein
MSVIFPTGVADGVAVLTVEEGVEFGLVGFLQLVIATMSVILDNQRLKKRNVPALM